MTGPAAISPVVNILTVTRGRGGTALVTDLYEGADRLAAVLGRPVRVSGVQVPGGPLDPLVLSTVCDLIARSHPVVVVETLGLPGPAALVAERALRASASVVTSSEALVALCAPRLHDLAAAHGVAFLIARGGAALPPLVLLAARPTGAAWAMSHRPQPARRCWG
jgi:homoserine dehydrogenase